MRAWERNKTPRFRTVTHCRRRIRLAALALTVLAACWSGTPPAAGPATDPKAAAESPESRLLDRASPEALARSLAAVPSERRTAALFYAGFGELDRKLWLERDAAVADARRGFERLLDAVAAALPGATRQAPTSLLLPDRNGFLSFPYESAAGLYLSGAPGPRAKITIALDGPEGPPQAIELGDPGLATAVGADDTTGSVSWLDPLDLPEGHEAGDGHDHGPPGVALRSRIREEGGAWHLALTPSDRRDLILQRDFARAAAGWAADWVGRRPGPERIPELLNEYERLQRRHGQ